ncbi:MAG: hypothetical protein ACWA6X_10640 [Bauldia sp.]
MARSEDAERLKVLSSRIAVLRQELAGLRAERDALMARMRTLPGPTADSARMAVPVSYGEDGKGLFLADIPKARTEERPEAAPEGSATEPDVEDR